MSLALFLSNFFVLAQEKSIDSIVVDTLKNNKILIDKVDRKAKGYVSVDNKNKIITLFDRAVFYLKLSLIFLLITIDEKAQIILIFY